MEDTSAHEIREAAIVDNEAAIRGIAAQIARLKELVAGGARQEAIKLLESANARLQLEVNRLKAERAQD